MLLSLVRFVLGLAAAALVAGAVQVAFVAGGDLFAGGRLERLGTLALLAAVQSAVFAAPFALLAAGLASRLTIRSRLYFAAAGVAIALAGFFVQSLRETGVEAALSLNRYALAAYAASGLAAGLAYRLVAVPKRRQPDLN